MKTCKFNQCGATLLKKQHESQSNFDKRDYCDRKCRSAAKSARSMTIPKMLEHQQLVNRALGAWR